MLKKIFTKFHPLRWALIFPFMVITEGLWCVFWIPILIGKIANSIEHYGNKLYQSFCAKFTDKLLKWAERR